MIRPGVECLSPVGGNGQARALLQSWLAEDVHTSDRSMEILKTELDADRESGRKLFPCRTGATEYPSGLALVVAGVSREPGEDG